MFKKISLIKLGQFNQGKEWPTENNMGFEIQVSLIVSKLGFKFSKSV